MPRLEAIYLKKPVEMHVDCVEEALGIVVDGRRYPAVRRELEIGTTETVTPPLLEQGDAVYKVIVPPSSEGVLFTYRRSDQEASVCVIARLSEKTRVAYFHQPLNNNRIRLHGILLYTGDQGE